MQRPDAVRSPREWQPPSLFCCRGGGAQRPVRRRIGNPLMVPGQGQVIAPTDHGLPFESSRRSGALGLFLAAALLAGEAVHRILQHGVPLLVERLALLRPFFGSQLLVVGNRLELLF